MPVGGRTEKKVPGLVAKVKGVFRKTEMSTGSFF